MTTDCIDYTIEFFSLWHCGSGLAAGADVDERVIRDKDGLPYVPGRTVKGLLRDAADTLHRMAPEKFTEEFITYLFGKSADEDGNGQNGAAWFRNATLDEHDDILAEKGLKDRLYCSIASTAIGDDGIAKDHTLRKIEAVVPCTVHGKIYVLPEMSDSYRDNLKSCMAMVKRLGLGRSRGLGRCEFRLCPSAESPEPAVRAATGKKLQFKCTLLSDVVLSASPATQGGGSTLDFIPGNVFLGIAASSIYKKEKEDEHTWLLFHSGHVRFGDAHPSRDGHRGLHIPAAIYYPKYPRQPESKDSSRERYVLCLTDTDDPTIKKMQLKQCRNGYYVFDDGQKTATLVKTEKAAAIKSAYDSLHRRSMDEQMFTYQALRKDLVMYFEIELDDDAAGCADELRKALIGVRYIGRSRSAEYGFVRIENASFDEPESQSSPAGKTRDVAVYADGRLIFLDRNGRPSFQPTAEDLGFPGGDIRWDKSQIRSFQYAPWNSKRHAFGNDRCGIEKGSVFIVNTSLPVPKDSYVGSYNNEGFGKVLYDPPFLEARDDGHCVYEFSDDTPAASGNTEDNSAPASGKESPLLRYLRARGRDAGSEGDILRAVNSFVEESSGLFTNGGESFASQWGTIRNLAMCIDKNDVLYGKVIEYLTHGVAGAKWEERSRLARLKEFMEKYKDTTNLRKLLVNLSSEMAKICGNKR